MRDRPPMGDAAMRRVMGDTPNRKFPLLSVELARTRRNDPGESIDLVKLPTDPLDVNDLTSSSTLLSSNDVEWVASLLFGFDVNM